MVQKEVHEYLRSGTEKGFSLKELKRELIKAGHEIKVVEEEAKRFERKNAFKLISVFAVVIVFSLIVIFGFKGFIFENEKSVVGTNLDNLEKNNANLNTNNLNYDFNDCKIDNKGYGLCCVRNNKLVDCSNEQYFNKNEFVIFRINLKDLIKDKINEKFYKECTTSYIREKIGAMLEKKVYCAGNIDRDKDFVIELKGFISNENLINIKIINSISDFDNNVDPENSIDLFNLRVKVK